MTASFHLNDTMKQLKSQTLDYQMVTRAKFGQYSKSAENRVLNYYYIFHNHTTT